MVSGELLDLPEQYSPGSMNIVCPYCNSISFPGDTFNCCHNGKVIIPEYAFPESLETLYTDQTPVAKNFRKYIRKYNTLFSFASMSANYTPPTGRGPPIFRICGQIYHRTASLYPPENHPPSFHQLYILDPEEANRYRFENPVSQNCVPEVMEIISKTLEESNPYVYHLKNMHQVILEQDSAARSAGIEPPQISLHLRTGPDRRRYNAPAHHEVAALFTAVDGVPQIPKDVVVYPHDHPLRAISIWSPNCDPLSFPLLFPCGEPGWQPNIAHVSENATDIRSNTTLLQYCTFRWADRGNFNPLLYGDMLTQQKMCDDFLKVDAQRAEHQRQRQTELRVESLKGLHDHVRHIDSIIPNPVIQIPGHPVILPSSFIGSPRNMAESYQDAMAMVRVIGKPDLFITFTCNSHWPEIHEHLKPGQIPENRPDLVARVFKLYLTEFLQDINKRYVLGKTDAYIHVIEFQKRGLPHAHMLVHLSDEDKLKTPEQVDFLISAEIPDPHLYPHLHHLVTAKMMHGPCGSLNPENICMENGVCTKGFPKPFCEDTVLPPDSYPHYRRRDDGRFVIVKGKPLDNRYVVPYNPFLLCKYGAHINVEACTCITAVKYIYKYTYKGHDCAALEIQSDEIQQFLDTRYISAPEAAWRLFEFRLQGRSHTVEKLPVHLPDMQSVFFKRGEETPAIERALLTDTKLTAWFKLNIIDANARQYLYTEIPLHYCWIAKPKKWTPRQRDRKVVTRLVSVSPRDTERHHLRILLLYSRGPKSFDDLKTVNDHICASFMEACEHQQLLQTDEVWKQTLTEACSHGMPYQLRQLFAHILLFCNVTDPLLLWQDFFNSLIEDFRINHNERISQQKALNHIQMILQASGKSLINFGLPVVDITSSLSTAFDFDIDEEDRIASRFTLNSEQSLAAEAILNACLDEDTSTSKLFFLNGQGGCGKTYTYNYLVHKVRSLSNFFMTRQASCSALTGIAATLLLDGKTTHSTFKLPIPCFENSSIPISPNTSHAEYLRKISLFIIDEASMLSVHAFNAIDRMMRDITRNLEVPFGGKVFVFGGDFRQLLPVVKRASPSVIIENTITTSPLWQQYVQILSLKHNMRLRHGQHEFGKFLLNLGDGTLPVKETQPFIDCIPLPSQCVIDENIVDHIFPSNQDYDEDIFSSRAILCPTNQMTFDINSKVLQLVPSAEKTYFSVASIQADGTLHEEQRESYPLEYLNSLTPSGLPQHKLVLKVGAVAMLLRNIDTSAGLTNGTRISIKRMYRNFLDVKILTGSASGNRVFLPRMQLIPSDSSLPFLLCRRQFPIRVSYAMTINKSQGQTFEKIGIFMPTPCFAHGQLYVAFSRARALDDITVQVLHVPQQQGKDRGITYTKNIVYRQILQS